jgi:ABC-type dipeptide/oligopeptide/nickel transport system permease component
MHNLKALIPYMMRYKKRLALGGVMILFAAAYVLVNLAVDITYTFLDPRIRYG